MVLDIFCVVFIVVILGILVCHYANKSNTFTETYRDSVVYDENSVVFDDEIIEPLENTNE